MIWVILKGVRHRAHGTRQIVKRDADKKVIPDK
jgi:hypothetical protein